MVSSNGPKTISLEEEIKKNHRRPLLLITAIVALGHGFLAGFFWRGSSCDFLSVLSPSAPIEAVLPQPRHAIVVPYRNRTYHLKVMEKYLGGYLSRNSPHETFSFWVIEQYNSDLFNRGWLANVGIKMVSQLYPNIQCIIFHDVDLIPKNGTFVPYNDCDRPTQLGSELQHWGWGVPYKNSAGGIVSMHVRHWYQINGFSNDFEGWGGEDDDLFQRLRVNGLLDNSTKTIRRPSKGHGIFNTISEDRHHHPEKVKVGKEYKNSQQIIISMEQGSNRWKSDGLSDLTYKILGFENSSSPQMFVNSHHLRVVP